LVRDREGEMKTSGTEIARDRHRDRDRRREDKAYTRGGIRM
jgi:hypothetical protein